MINGYLLWVLAGWGVAAFLAALKARNPRSPRPVPWYLIASVTGIGGGLLGGWLLTNFAIARAIADPMPGLVLGLVGAAAGGAILSAGVAAFMDPDNGPAG